MATWSDGLDVNGYPAVEDWANDDAAEAVDVEDLMGEDDGSLSWASEAWMRARGIASVDCHGNYVYEEGFDSY